MVSYEVTKERLRKKTNIKVADEILNDLKDFVEKDAYKVKVIGYWGTNEEWYWKLKVKVPDLSWLSDEDDNHITKQIHSPPFFEVRMAKEYAGCKIGDKGWNLTVSKIQEIDGDHYIQYDVFSKHESIINLLLLLKACKVDEVNEHLKTMIFAGVNNLFDINIDSIELAGVDSIVNDCVKVLTTTDKRLVNRHILLCGTAGCGKSEIVKAIISKTKDWVHFPLSNDINDWGEFMQSLNKLMKFLERRVMIVIDEIDEIGLSRDKDATRVYDLLRVMDGVNDMNHIKFVATSNRPNVIDTALKRIGRFGPVILMERPDEETTKKIIEFYMKRYGVKNLDIQKILTIRDGATGSEIRAAFENCIIYKESLITKNIIKHLLSILESRKVAMKDYTAEGMGEDK